MKISFYFIGFCVTVLYTVPFILFNGNKRLFYLCHRFRIQRPTLFYNKRIYKRVQDTRKKTLTLIDYNFNEKPTYIE